LLFPSLDPRAATGLTAAIALLLVLVAYYAGYAILRRLVRVRPIATAFVVAAHAPGLAAVLLLALQITLQSAPDGMAGIEPLRHAASVLLIAAVTWLAINESGAVSTAAELAFPLNVADNLNARRIVTQTRVLTRTLSSVIVVVGLSLALLTFPGVRNIGASLLASAGILGIIVGVAAKPMFGNLLAGLQIAMTQPVRLDDVVVIEGEWGRIEEIGRTYVVVAIWDQRRLVVPLQYFVEKPIQNWTLRSGQILGTVFLWTDYGVPLEPLRAELRRLCEQKPELWDGRVCLLQVTEAGERAMQLRALVSSSDAGRSWDLRCFVREGLLEFIRREWPGTLPHARAELALVGGAGRNRTARRSPDAHHG
jgi:small-conductance mechanosensitive channel